MFLLIDAFNLLSFSQATYTVAESDGQVEVCVNSLVPLASDALATILTVPQSATGTCNNILSAKPLGNSVFRISYDLGGGGGYKKQLLAEH